MGAYYFYIAAAFAVLTIGAAVSDFWCGFFMGVR